MHSISCISTLILPVLTRYLPRPRVRKERLLLKGEELEEDADGVVRIPYLYAFWPVYEG